MAYGLRVSGAELSCSNRFPNEEGEFMILLNPKPETLIHNAP